MFSRIKFIFLLFFFHCFFSAGQVLPHEFISPPREFSVLPFWFWNDTITEKELIMQIDDFEKHGVYGFVIHPRIGLPENIKWLSSEMIRMMRIAIEEADRRKMYVVLYDEGMYPSGSSAGQVVERNPDHASKGLAMIDPGEGKDPVLPEGWKLVTKLTRPGGQVVLIAERPSGGVIRGLHYIREGTDMMKEETHPSGDILNPEAVSSYIELVYEKYAKEFGEYFGNTIIGIFTDEPSPLGRSGAKGVIPGNASLLNQISDILGYDFTPFITDLWFSDRLDSEIRKKDYFRAVNICLEENYYKRLSDWCRDHNLSLAGHPGGSMDIGAERYFQIPGQDLVWRYVEPGPKALYGEHSTMAKCASSAMIHLNRRRNGNELYGAYGHNLTYNEMVWLANWCFVRGQNLLYPHAFYYSVRGPRRDERPPDVGPNAEWWDNYKVYADACSRMCWLNTDSRHVCEIAVLANDDRLSDRVAKICFENQRDFNYLELRHLWEDVEIKPDGIHLAGMVYKAVILDSLLFITRKSLPFIRNIAKTGRLIIYKGNPDKALLNEGKLVQSPEDLIKEVDNLVKPDVIIHPPSRNIRYRHVVKEDLHFYFLFNEENSPVNSLVRTHVKGKKLWINPFDPEKINPVIRNKIEFEPYEMKILMIR